MEISDLEQVAREICLGRKWTFVRSVGEGTFKQTFLITTEGNSQVALKIYKAASANRREEREIAAMLRCEHPHIARILSVDSHQRGGAQFLSIMEEFLSGGSLTDKAPISRDTGLQLGTQLIDALGHIADMGLVHRDIKPDNILFREDGITAVLTDFGVVRDLSESSITPTWAPRGPGTPFFASPEQLNNEKLLIDWRSDQFTLGIVLGYVVLGCHAFDPGGAHPHEIVERVAAKEKPCDTFRQGAAEIGLPVIVKMIEPWPINRFRTPQKLRGAWQAQ